MSWPIRILRAFLGTTFVFAGIQKFLDPNFLRRGGGDYIGTQLAGFANATPAAPLMRILERAPMLTGVAIATLEIAIGLGTLLRDRDALSITHSDWRSTSHSGCLPPGTSIRISSGPTRRMPSRGWRSPSLSSEQERSMVGHVAGPIEHLDGISRREFARGSLVAGLAIALGVAAKAFAAPMSSSGLKGLGPQTHPSIGEGASPSATEGPVAAPATAGRVLTTLQRLPVGGAVGFTDPQVGPAALLHLSNDEVVAYGRTCTHAGCLWDTTRAPNCSCAHVTARSSIPPNMRSPSRDQHRIRSLPSKSSWTSDRRRDPPFLGGPCSRSGSRARSAGRRFHGRHRDS